MALAQFPGFIGGSYTSWSPYADAQDTMNLFVEQIESKPATVAGGSAVPASLALYGTPGLTLFATLPTSPIRGIWANATRLFAIAGAVFYEVFSNGTYTARGAVANDGLPVQIIPNGNQVLIVSGGFAYCDNGSGPVLAAFSTGLAGNVSFSPGSLGGSVITWVSGNQFDATLIGSVMSISASGGGFISPTITGFTSPTEISTGSGLGTDTNRPYTITPAITAKSGCFLDGYFIIVIPNSRQINISAINDGTKWSSLDFAIKEAYPDNIAANLADHEELWLFGNDTCEVWQNTGAASFPLARIPGALIPHGCCAAASPVRLGESVGWLSNDAARGGVVAYLAQGFQPARISTSAIEQIWRGYSTVADAVSYTYVDQGHEFWVITFPTANATWCYDRTSGYWARRGWWNGSSNDRQRGMFHAWVFGKHIVGDWSTGAIYTMDMATTTDAGTQITRVRAARLPSTKSADWSYLHKFRLIADNTGALNPSLDYSLDGGKNFIGARTTAAPLVSGAFGYYDWRNLGRHRDRVLRITITAAVKVALIEAATDAE